MKVRILLFLMTLTISNLLGAQSTYGLTAGVGYVNNVSNYGARFSPINSFEGNYEYRISYQLGGFFTIPLNDDFSIRTELLLASKGGKIELDNTINLKLIYLNTPILAQYLITDKIVVELGPELGYLISAKVKSKGSEAGDVSHIYENKIDFGIKGGTRFLISEQISINLSYNHGLSKVTEFDIYDNSGSPRGKSSSYNRAFQVGISYTLN